MNIDSFRDQVGNIENKFKEMRELAYIDPGRFKLGDNGESPELPRNGYMHILCPDENARLHQLWHEIEKTLPPGFSVNGDLLRHLSFNQSNDWSDIYAHDIPNELARISEYRNKLTLIEYLDSLHPDVARASSIVLSGDLDAALKVVFTSFDVRVRSLLKLRPDESTMPAIGKAFKDGVLRSPVPESSDGVRNFLQGVTGYYRNVVIHNPLPKPRNRLEASLSLFALAHEAHILLDRCIYP